MPLNKQQQAAVEYLNGPLLVLAGPGTGKTQLLSSKVAYILENTDASPENILCITFTEAATANMRSRLAGIIGTAAHHVNISTYHAFGTEILKQYKNYTTTYTRQLDNPIDTVTSHIIIRDLLKTLDPLDPLRANSIKDVLDTINSAKKARLSPKDLIKISKDNKRIGAAITPAISDLIIKLRDEKIKKYEPAVEQIYTPILEILAKYISSQPVAGQIEPLANTMTIELKQAIDDGGSREKPSVQPLTAWYKRYFEVAPDGSWRLKDYIANLKLESLAKIYKAYEDFLTKNGFYDFNDMIEETINILEQDKGFRMSLSEKYQYILLDEFQDTNPSQFKIIDLLTDYEQPQIMAVGDDDQTIFEFQGARPDNLLDFQKRYSAKVINLYQNYRSTTEIVDLGRAIAEQIPDSFEKKFGIAKKLKSMRNNELRESVLNAKNMQTFTSETVPRISYEKSEASDTCNGRLARAGLSGKTSDIFDDKHDSHIRRIEFTSADGEYSWLASEIANLIAAGEEPSNIGIITPQHKFIQPLLPYLKDQNIPIAYEKSEDILKDQKITELNTLARFIYKLSQAEQPTHQLLEILSYPFWQIPSETILTAIHHDNTKPTLSQLAESDDKSLQKAGKILTELVTKSINTPLEKFLDYLIGTLEISDNLKSPFIDYYGQANNYSTFELYNNLFTLREKATTHLKSTDLTLKDYIKFLDDYQEANAAITTTSPYQDSEHSVQIMTVHKSKGLEFKHVYLIATDDDNWGNASGNRNMLSLPKNLLPIRQDGTSESELLRKFFVAVTRAEIYLTMTNSIRNYAGKTPPRLEYLAEYDKDDNLFSPLIPSGKVIKKYEDISEAKLRTNLHTGWLSYYYQLTPNLKNILLKRLENYKLTASDLTSFIDIIYSGPAEFYKNKILRAPQEPATYNIYLGILIHNTFEKITKEGITDDEALDFCRTQLNELPISTSEKTELEAATIFSLQKSLAKFANIIRNPHSKAELDLFSEHPTLDNIPLTGKLDHININEKDKTIEIYDFKTSNHPERVNFNGRDKSLFKYRLQLGFYKLLLNLSPSFSKYTVTRGHILFVKPDKFDEVYDEVYVYNDRDEEELKKLIKVVYNHIKTLDYLDSPELMLEKDENRKPKDLFDFIDRLLSE
ncbi:ATP-dependent helicase [Candidatus Saccharibacteria bacterium]|nr:ATP-dependent helicase [Candidatus Saccharibacteria bacterium]